MPTMNGALILDKPAGMTSHDVVARVRKIIGERRVGHTGTLDPFATGVLVVLVGRATRLAQFLSGAEKEYEAVIRFGYATETGDLTGQPIGSETRASPPSLRPDEIDAALASLRGESEQLPPMFSAKKIAGRKLYEHARRGEEIERQPVRVTIHTLELISSDHEVSRVNDDGSADVSVRVVCSAGTYIRTLAEDLGKQLGTGAHLIELRRTRAGRFALAETSSLEALAQAKTSGFLLDLLISPCDALSHLPMLELDEEQSRRTSHGMALPIPTDDDCRWHNGEAVRLVMDRELIAVGRFNKQTKSIDPTVVFTGA